MELPESVTNMPPQRLLLIVGAGVGAGLLWRHFSNKKSSGSLDTGDSTNPYDAMQGAGNLGGLAPNIGGEPTDTSSDRRDVFGSGINLPVAQWVIVGSDGKKYLTDGATITPLEGATPTPTTPTPTTPTTVPRTSRMISAYERLRAGPSTPYPGYTSLVGTTTASGATIVSEIPPTTPGGLRQVYTTRGIEIV